MVHLPVPVEAFQSERGVIHVEHFEFVVFIAGIEDEVAVVIPAQSVVHYILRLAVHHGIVPSSVLHHHRLHLCNGVGHAQVAVAYGHCHLLVPAVQVTVCIGCHGHAHFHLRLHHHEASREYLAVAGIFVVDGDLVVAAHLQPAAVVGNLQPVMCVELIGVHRGAVVVDGVAFGKSCTVVAGKQLLRHTPVGLAVFQPIGISVVVVGQVVKGDDDGSLLSQGNEGDVLPVVARRYLQCGHAWTFHLVALGEGGEGREGGEQQGQNSLFHSEAMI